MINVIKRIPYVEGNPTTPAFEIITALVREVFGTYFLEEGSWSFPDEAHIIGRTYFADRKKAKYAVNDKTVDCLILIYELAFNGQSFYNPTRVSENLVNVLKEQYNLDVSYAMFFDDDTPELRAAKIRALRAVIREILFYAKNRELIDPSCVADTTKFIRTKLFASVMRYSQGTYTETVINALDKRLRQSL